MPYTAEEIQTAVQSLVATTIRRPTDSLGVPQTQITFSDLQEAAMGIFLLYPTSPFYAVQLGASRLLDDLANQATLVTQLQAYLQQTNRLVLPVNNIAPLANANAALTSLQQAAAQRTTPFGSLASVPAYQNFNTNVNNFLKQNSSSIVQNGDVVPTPTEAKAQIKKLLPQIQSGQQALILSAGYLQNALNDFLASDLPAVATSSVFQKAQQNVANLVAQLQVQSPTDRLSDLRLTALSLLSTKAILQEVGAFTSPSSVYPISGTATAYSDNSRPANPASLVADLYAPYNITNSPSVTITMDGGAPITGTLSNSLYAELSGSTSENFVFTNSSQAILTGTNPGAFIITTGVNDGFSFYIRDPATGTLNTVLISALPAGANSATAIAAIINTAIAAIQLGGIYEAADDGSGHLQLRSTHFRLGSSYSILIGNGTANSTFGFTANQSVTGSDNNTQLVIEVNGSPNTVLFTPGTYTAAAAAAFINAAFPTMFLAQAQGNSGSQFVSIRYIGTTPPTLSATLSFPSSFAGGNAGATILGMPFDLPVTASPSTARAVAKNFTQITTQLTASTEVDPLIGGSGLNMRSDPSDGSLIYIYRTNGTTGTVTPGIGTTLTLITPAGLLAAGVVIGDTLVFTDGVNANTKWAITAVTDTSVTASGTVVPTGGAASYEIGPTFTVSYGYVIQVPSGQNNGTYTIVQQGPSGLAIPYEFKIDQLLLASRDAGGRSILFTGNIGRERLVINSNNKTVSSSVTISGAGAALFFATPPGHAIGTTTWLQLPETVQGLGQGDMLESYVSSYNIPANTYSIATVSGTIMGLVEAVPSNSAFVFVTSTPPPFALLRSNAYVQYLALSSLLKTWLIQSANTVSYFSELNRVIGVVLNEPQPTASDVQTALTQLLSLLNILAEASSQTPTQTLEYALSNYSVNRVTPIDHLVTTYNEKGCQKAVDTLLSGQFSAFFGLTLQSSSYAGSVLNSLGAVAQNDVPVRKIDRTDAATSPVISSAQSPDFEYDSSDVDQSPNKNIPSQFEQVTPSESLNR